MTIRRLILSATALAVLASPATADDWNFYTPSKNIVCNRDPGEGGNPAAMRCDMVQMPANAPPAPKTCKLIWGDSFYIAAGAAVGKRLCHDKTDTTTADPGDPLPYGSVWKEAGFTCTSRTTGLSCVNPHRHGFTISREVQKLF